MENWTNAKLCDVANLILGAVLFFSPWMFGFDAGKASENANIAGIAIAVLAVAALAAFAVWEEWLNLIVGGLPGNHRDDGPCGDRRRGRDPRGSRTLAAVPDSAAAHHRPLRH